MNWGQIANAGPPWCRGRSIGLCAILCGALLGCAESSESPEVLVEHGHLMESRGRFAEAIDAYTKAAGHRPNDATIYYDRGVAFGRLNQWKEAVEDYTRAIEHDPGMAKAYNNRAAAYAQQHQFERAVADFTKAISLDPRSGLTYRNRGLAYHDLGQFNQAIEDETIAIRLDPTVFEGPFERGNAYLDAGEFPKAIADFDRAIAIDSTRAGAWMNRGEAFRRLGDPKRAQADFDKARQLDPGIVPTVFAQSPAPKVLAPSAENHAAQPDSVARRERALRVAADFLKSKGFHVDTAAAPAPFDLLCEKGSRKLRVEVQTPPEPHSALRFTREQIDAAARSDQPTALIVVGKLASPTSAGLPYTGGTVVQFVENWKPVREKLVPVVFEYPLP
jgi:tetratricopeptide (TPR) repeat protein